MNKKTALRFALQQTAPVIPGYLFIGLAFGLMLGNAGFNFIWALVISACVYAGSMQFVMITLLSGGAGLLYTAMMTIFVNGRHVFYGLSLVENYRQMGKRYPYMIFTLTDETFSIICRTRVPTELNEKDVMFYISLLNHCYWIVGSGLGGLVGHFFPFDSRGIDFSMTALFIAIIVEQWQEKYNRGPVIIGLFFSLAFLVLLGPDRFILPSLAVSVFILLIRRDRGVEAIG